MLGNSRAILRAVAPAGTPSIPVASSASQGTGAAGQLDNGSAVRLAQATPLKGVMDRIAEAGDAQALADMQTVPAFATLTGRLAVRQEALLRVASYRQPMPGDRYIDIQPLLHTAWPCPADTMLNGNCVSVAGRRVAIAAQYPRRESLCAFLNQLMLDGAPLLVVLASDAEIADPAKGLPDYFRPQDPHAVCASMPGMPADAASSSRAGLNAHTGKMMPFRMRVQTLVAMQPIAAPGLANISEGAVTVIREFLHPMEDAPVFRHALPVVHLRNVPKLGQPSQQELEWLGYRIRAAGNERLPVVHCCSGTQRTGLVLSAAVLSDPVSTASVETVIHDIRATRHPTAFAHAEYRASAACLGHRHGKALLAAEAPPASGRN